MSTTSTTSMTTKQIAGRLKELCTKGEYDQAQSELFTDNAVSIEQEASPMFDKETTGLKAMREKRNKFEAMVEKVHSNNISDPLIASNSIAFLSIMDVTMKGRPRETMSELWVYKVKDGKIISEQFFM